MKKQLTLLVLASLMMFSPAYADDVADIEKLLTEIAEASSGTEAYTEALNQLDSQQMDMLLEQFGYGDLLNDDEAQKDREWSPDSWEDALEAQSGGNSERYQQLVDEYKANHPYLADEEMQKGSSASNASDYEQQVQTNRAAMSHASYSFEDVNKHLENINELSKKINEDSNPKAIAEINARINAEVAYLQVEQIKSLAVLNEQMAQDQASGLVHEKAASEFNQIPDK